MGWGMFRSTYLLILSIPGRPLINLSSYMLSSAVWEEEKDGSGERVLHVHSMTGSTRLDMTFPSLDRYSSSGSLSNSRSTSKGDKVRSYSCLYLNLPVRFSLYQKGYAPWMGEASGGVLEVMGRGEGGLEPSCPTPLGED